jgi:hypothetical protein
VGGLRLIGSSGPLRRALFPTGFSGVVMNLVYEAWQTFQMDLTVCLEERITALFARKLKEQYRVTGRIWFVTIEEPVSDPTSGRELGRTDIRFYPIDHKDQTIFFTIECKRLHVQTARSFRKLGNKYVMLGYVLDDRVQDGFDLVSREILSRKEQLRMVEPNCWVVPSKVLSTCPFTADTLHSLSDGEFTVHHVLVPTTPRWNTN